MATPYTFEQMVRFYSKHYRGIPIESYFENACALACGLTPVRRLLAVSVVGFKLAQEWRSAGL